MTLEEVGGELGKQHLVYIGDGNNVVTSLVEGSALTGLAVTVITPDGYAPPASVLQRARAIDSEASRITVTNDISKVDGATAVYTDVWASMGQEGEREARRKAFARVPGQPGADGPGAACRLHALPARASRRRGDRRGHRRPAIGRLRPGGNRLYAQMALMAELFGAPVSQDPPVLHPARRMVIRHLGVVEVHRRRSWSPFVLYQLLRLLRGTQGTQIWSAWCSSRWSACRHAVQPHPPGWLFRNAAFFIVIAVIVMFQPELRRALDQIGRLGHIAASAALSPATTRAVQPGDLRGDPRGRASEQQARTGALIAFEREVGLEDYAATGVRINGDDLGRDAAVDLLSELAAARRGGDRAGNRSSRPGACCRCPTRESSASGSARDTARRSACRSRRTRSSSSSRRRPGASR